MKIGSLEIKKARFGNTEITKMYLGDFLVYQKTEEGLPARYQKVAYLQSSQTNPAWLNLGQVWNDNIKVEMEFKELQSTIVNAYWLFGSYSGKYFSLGTQKNYVGGNDIAYRLGTSDAYQHAFALDQTIWNTIVMDTTTITYNGTSYALVGTYQKPSIDFLLFGANYGSGTPYRIDRLQLFTLKSFKIYNGNTLTHDYVPCYDTENGNKPGMYDLVSRQFLVNQGTGADFIVGPDVHDLPAEFQEVEYLQGDGSSYIDTGVLLDNVFETEVEFQSTDTSQFTRRIVVGSRNGTSYYYAPNVNTSLGSIQIQIANDSYRNIYSQNISNKYKFKMSNNNGNYFYELKEGETIVAEGNGTYSLALQKITPLCLFAVNNAGTYQYSFIGKIFKAKLGIHTFIPCYNKTTLVAGMYDLITKQFKTNSGAGSFIVGPDIN